MTISATIIADSVSPFNIRLLTWVLIYPRFIHAELMTHRMFSRNASSSRAIPVAKQLQRIMDDVATFVSWGSNKPGMQASECISSDVEKQAKEIWIQARNDAVLHSQSMAALNVHKQIVNRIAEPFSHIAVIVSATEWANFFALRNHPDAQPEFQALAKIMYETAAASTPKLASVGQWHLPFVQPDELNLHPLETLRKCSVARCARVSYFNHDGSTPDVAKDVELHDRLVVSKPLHASPAEHQATPFFKTAGKWAYPFDAKWNSEHQDVDLSMPWSGNFRGWFQYRQGLRDQNVLVMP